MAPKIERILENFTLAEGPHWDEEKQVLYFVDIPAKTINRFDPKLVQHSQANVGEEVSFIIPVLGEENRFVISLGTKIVKITWDGISDTISNVEKLAEVENAVDLQFNDAKVDPEGRLWLGTLGKTKDFKLVEGKGSFYSYSNGKLIKHFDKVDISNGLAWNSDLNKFYYIDTGKGSVDQFDYDPKKGTIANREAVFTFSKHNIPGGPDGMTIDADGNLWVAVFGGNRVIKIDPRKPETVLDTIELPAKQITSVAFGGPNFEDLYVTSGAIPQGDEILIPPIHGAIYRISNLNSKGTKGLRFRC